MRFRVLLFATALFVSSLSIADRAAAQSFAPGQFMIGGMTFACGPAVWTHVAFGVGDGARAVPGNPPSIYLEASLFPGLPPAVQGFIFAHECGHFVVGMNENAADCWAAQMGRRQGWFAPEDMNYLVQVFQWNPGDWTHAPGHVRLQNIWNCYANAQ